jgi:uncharacterized membrane protein YecN with MAPEG domain
VILLTLGFDAARSWEHRRVHLKEAKRVPACFRVLKRAGRPRVYPNSSNSVPLGLPILLSLNLIVTAPAMSAEEL